MGHYDAKQETDSGNHKTDKEYNLVTSIDPKISYVKKLEPSSLLVYKVKRTVPQGEKDNATLLKAAPLIALRDCAALLNEEKALKRLAGIRGVPQFIQSYSNHPTHYAILKEFIEGESLAQKYQYNIISTQKKAYTQSTLDALIAQIIQIHERGVVKLEINADNIILDANEQPHLPDYTEVKFKENLTKNLFEQYAKQDIDAAKNMICNTARPSSNHYVFNNQVWIDDQTEEFAEIMELVNEYMNTTPITFINNISFHKE